MTAAKEKPLDSPLIHRAMLSIMGEIGAIEKSRKMQGGGISYNFRGIDQVYEAIHPLMIKHGVYMTAEVLDKAREERTTIKRDDKYGDKTTVTAFTSLRMRYHFVAADGSSVHTEAEGEGMDSGDKSSNKAMAVAHKYAILQAFCVPTEAMDDPDTEVHEVQPRQAETPTVGSQQYSATDALVDAERCQQAINAAKTIADLDAIVHRNKALLNQMKGVAIDKYDATVAAATRRKEYLNTNAKAA